MLNKLNKVIPQENSAAEVIRKLEALRNPEQARFHTRFFKTGPGEYGEGDKFLGLCVPVLRKMAQQYRHLPLTEIEVLLHSPFHEARLLAVIIMVKAYQSGTAQDCEALFQCYINHSYRINNWDIIDVSAPHIVGAHLYGKSPALLHKLAVSESLWERRIAILATFYMIRKGEYENTLAIAQKLLGDKQDLIHKAVGWMLREVAKRDLNLAKQFLRKHLQQMPRTALRYAIEKFPEALRKQYLRGAFH